MSFWLLKTEPRTFSWDDLKNQPNRTTPWEGVRNYQARNIIRDEIKVDDEVFIYHSVVKPMAIMGIGRIVKASYPDYFAFDPDHKYFDPKSDPQNPSWFMFDVQAISEFVKPITLTSLKSQAPLQRMRLLQKGSRLSVQPVSPVEWMYICESSRLIKLP